MSQLPELEPAVTCACEQGEMCPSIRPGHTLHALQLTLAASTPSRWRDALVTAVHANGLVDAVTLDGRSLTLWNHGDLASSVAQGDPIGLHAEYNVLTAGSRRFNVLVR